MEYQPGSSLNSPESKAEKDQSATFESQEQNREQLEARVEELKESFKGYVKKYAEFIAKKEDTTLEELQSRPNGYLSNLIREAWKSYSSEMITDPQDHEAPLELIEADRVLESIIKEAGGEIDLIRVSNNPEQKITSINNPLQFKAQISQEDNEYFLETTGYRAKEGQTIPSRVPIISKPHFNKKYLGENQGIVTRCLVFQDKEGNWVADIIAAPTLENTNSNNNNNGSIDFVANRVMDSSMKTEIVNDPEVEEQIESSETPEKKEAFRQYRSEVEGDIEKYLAELIQETQPEVGENETGQESPELNQEAIVDRSKKLYALTWAKKILSYAEPMTAEIHAALYAVDRGIELQSGLLAGELGEDNFVYDGLDENHDALDPTAKIRSVLQSQGVESSEINSVLRDIHLEVGAIAATAVQSEGQGDRVLTQARKVLVGTGLEHLINVSESAPEQVDSKDSSLADESNLEQQKSAEFVLDQEEVKDKALKVLYLAQMRYYLVMDSSTKDHTEEIKKIDAALQAYSQSLGTALGNEEFTYQASGTEEPNLDEFFDTIQDIIVSGGMGDDEAISFTGTLERDFTKGIGKYSTFSPTATVSNKVSQMLDFYGLKQVLEGENAREVEGLQEVLEEAGEDVITVLDEEETFTQDSEDLDKINQEISTLEAEIQRLKDEEEKVDQSKKEGINAEYKKLEKQLLEKKREKVRIENAEYINRKLEDLQTIKKRLDAVRNGEALDESRTDLPSDLESLQVLYQKEFTKTVNILAGLHMREEMKNLYKSQFDHIIKEYDEAEAAEESKVVTGFKALAKKWKSIPAHRKIVVGLGLGVVAGFGGGGAVIAGAAGFGLTAMKGMSVTSTWVGMDSWTQQRLEKGRIDEVKAKIQSLKKDNSDARSVIELMALATTTRELTGKEVLSQDELNEILELSAKKFTQKAESDVKIDDEKGLAKLNEKINNQEDAPTGGVNIEGQHVYTEISAVADYKQEQQERLNKNKREKFINRYVKSGGVALGVAFSGEILRGSFEGAQAMFDSAENGIESAVDSVPDLNFEGASSDGGDVGINDFDRNVSTEATSPSFDAGAGGNTPEAVQVGEVFGGNTYASRFGDIEVGRISEVLSERFPNDVISFDSGDTVSGELKTLLANHLGVEPDAYMLAEASYAFLTTHEGKLQLYELVSATETGQEALNHMGYTSLERFMDASPDFEEIMDLSEHMGTGELVGLNTFVEDMEAESIFGINEVQDYTSPFDNVDGVKISDRGVITEIDYQKAGITPEQISNKINNLGDNVEVVLSGSSPQISDRFRFIMSEALDVPWVKVDYNVAAPVMQEYFFHSDVGSKWVYDTVMRNAENPDLQVIKGYLESFAESQNMSLQDLGSEENKHLIKSALAGPNQGQYGTRLTAILAGVSRSVEPGQSLQIPNLRSEITRILTNKVTT